MLLALLVFVGRREVGIEAARAGLDSVDDVTAYYVCTIPLHHRQEDGTGTRRSTYVPGGGKSYAHMSRTEATCCNLYCGKSQAHPSSRELPSAISQGSFTNYAKLQLRTYNTIDLTVYPNTMYIRYLYLTLQKKKLDF